MDREIVRGLLDELGDREPAVPEQLGTLIAGAIARWPPWIDGFTFGRYVARRIDPALDLATAVEELELADLYLACACAGGIAGAHAALEQQYAANLRAVLATFDPRGDFIAEVQQVLREKILVERGGAPKIESYSGHGPLGAWLRVAAMRTALSLRRKRQPELALDDELDAVLDLAPNAEIRVIARELGDDLRATLRTAVAAQPSRMRAVMSMYYADNHGVEEIGRVYNVHASTVSRWLAKARAEILARTRAELLARRHSEASLDSLLGHVASLEVSFDSLLRSG